MRLANEFRRIHEQDATRLRTAAAAALTPAVRAMLLRKADENERLARGKVQPDAAADRDRG